MHELLLPIAAFVAGAVSISSPCSLPLLPAYLSYVAGLPMSELERPQARAKAAKASLTFIAGFTFVFTVLGILASLLGSVVLRNIPLVIRVTGVLIILMGLSGLGLAKIPFLQRERRLAAMKTSQGKGRGFVLGMSFAAGWVPCIGPVLAAVLALAAATSTAAWGAVLLVLYSLGLGLPFLALALGFARLQGAVTWLKRHGRGVEMAGGALLVLIGISFVTGAWHSLFIPLERSFARFGWPPI
jgi:cytochrome c-type biogenesis protein